MRRSHDPQSETMQYGHHIAEGWRIRAEKAEAKVAQLEEALATEREHWQTERKFALVADELAFDANWRLLRVVEAVKRFRQDGDKGRFTTFMNQLADELEAEGDIRTSITSTEIFERGAEDRRRAPDREATSRLRSEGG